MSSNNIEKGFKNLIGNIYDKGFIEAHNRDNCRYCHKPYLSLGISKDSVNEALVYLDVLEKDNIIKFCPVCGRNLKVKSYVEEMNKAREELENSVERIGNW